MSEKLDGQLQAITTLVKTLEPLSPEERKNVLDFVFRSLGISGSPLAPLKPVQSVDRTATPPGDLPVPRSTDIRSFTKAKSPSSANQMVAVVGYYLVHLAGEAEKRDTLVPDDIKKYFVQGGFPLPSAPARMTLHNAKSAGYLDAIGDGNYRLNPVGYNLVAHKLPRSTEGGSPRPAKPGRAKPGKTIKKPTRK